MCPSQAICKYVSQIYFPNLGTDIMHSITAGYGLIAHHFLSMQSTNGHTEVVRAYLTVQLLSESD